MSGLVIDTLYNFYFHFHIYIEKNNLKDYYNLNYSQKNFCQKYLPEEYLTYTRRISMYLFIILVQSH